jgi:hypothetical protein
MGPRECSFLLQIYKVTSASFSSGSCAYWRETVLDFRSSQPYLLLESFTMASKSDNVEINEHVPEMANTAETSQLGHLANQEDHEVGKLASFRKYPWACAWCIVSLKHNVALVHATDLCL